MAISPSSETPMVQPVYRNELPLGAKIVRSVAFGALRYVLLAPIPFVMTPLILHKIGVTGYGTWAVFLAINSMTSLADLGLVGTVSKFVAEYHAHRDFHSLNRLLNSGLAMFLVLAVVIGALVSGAAPALVHLLLRGSSFPTQELIFLLRWFVALVAANILIMLFSSITSGLQRLDLTYVMSAANILLSALFSAVLLFRGWQLRGLVFGYVCAAIFTALGYIVIIRKLLPEVSWNPMGFDVAESKKMVSFSLRLYTIQASVAIHNQIEKVFLASLVGLAPVGWFDIASDVALKIRSVVGLVLGPVLPAASELDALRDRARTRELYYRTHKYLALAGIPVVCGVIAFSARFVDLWLGPSMHVIAFPLALLVAINFVNLASGPAFLIFAGRGYLKPAIQSSILGIVLDIVLSLGLIYKFGFAGAAMGTSVSLFIAAVFLTWTFHNQQHYPFGRLLRESYLKPVLCSLFAIALILSAHSTTNLSWYGLAAMSLAFGAIYAIFILLSHFFDDYDWKRIELLVPAARSARERRARGIGWIAD
jgi:O-antigen/teichoic acid export membrane protein